MIAPDIRLNSEITMTSIEGEADQMSDSVTAVPKQETFDRVARHLRRQGRPSIRTECAEGAAYSGTYSGAYRGQDDCRCSAGCLIPDELYSADMEGAGVSDDQPAGIVIASLGHDMGVVLELQLLHDGLIETWSPVGISVGLRDIAASFGLDPTAATGPL